MNTRPLFLWACLLAPTQSLAAQLITIRTLPVNQSDQFAFFPSLNMGMGGVGIALADSLLDPFANPAKGVRLGSSRILSSPMTYSVSQGAGAGRTLPLGAMGRVGNWFGGAWVVLQEVDEARQTQNFGPVPLAEDVVDPQGFLTGLNARSHGNNFLFASLGKTSAAHGLSWGASAMWSGLHAVDGIDLLYSGSAGVKQLGHGVDLRLGALREFEDGRSLEAVLLFNHYVMEHDVTYLDLFWDPGTQSFNQMARMDQNLDRTNTWGLHLAQVRPLRAPGWRVGWIATANHMTHPKIPNYTIQSIPRDPGASNAFNLGVGLSRTRGPASFGLDVVFEPIWSHTWADAASPVVDALGDTIPAGGMTVENRFQFSNAVLRLGVASDFAADARVPSAAIQFGLVVRSISYRLRQQDHVQITNRIQDESWIEWTPTFGAALRLPGCELRYQGQITNGTGRPGVASRFLTGDRAAPTVGGGIIAAPSGPLTLEEVTVVSHRISISVPLR